MSNQPLPQAAAAATSPTVPPVAHLASEPSQGVASAAMAAPGAPQQATVVIVGAGIIGLSLAFELARRGEEVVVLERSRPGAGASSVAAGMLAPAAEAEHEDPDLLHLAQESLRRYPEFVRAIEERSGRSCELRHEGTLLVALNRDDEDELERLAAFQRRLGLACAPLTAEQARAREPQLSPRVTAALHAPHDHQVDPAAMVAALEAAVRALGGTVVTGFEVTGFETQGGRLAAVVGCRQAGGEAGSHATEEPTGVRCRVAVLAAGAWSSFGIAWPAEPFTVRPVKGQLVHLQGPELLQHVVRTPHVYLVPRRGGRLVIGATMEEMGFDATPTAGAVMDLLWQARLVVPAIYDLGLAEVKVGFRPATRDHRPLIGPAGVPGLYLATGHFRHGVLLAPATAMLLAEAITTGALPPLIAPFSPARQTPAEALQTAGSV
jgi:glycine oxidase